MHEKLPSMQRVKESKKKCYLQLFCSIFCLFFVHFFVLFLQLLNQLESSGAPPASAEKIDALPVVTVSQEQVGKEGPFESL